MSGRRAAVGAGASSGPDGAPSHSPVTVWRIPLDAAGPPDDEALSALSAAERARAARFATDKLRHRWLHGHVAMRRILARELGVMPRDLAYATGPHGKPHLASPAGTGLEFSYSDAERVALLAVSRAGPVGVDIEPILRPVEVEAIIATHFTPRERAAVLAADGEVRRAAFFRIWTRKEAVLKAIGAGLSFGLAGIDVLDDRASVAAGPEAAQGPWALHDLPTDPAHRAALATRPRTAWRWAPPP